MEMPRIWIVVVDNGRTGERYVCSWSSREKAVSFCINDARLWMNEQVGYVDVHKKLVHDKMLEAFENGNTFTNYDIYTGCICEYSINETITI